MRVVYLDYRKLAPMYKIHVDQGFHWGCQCGESFRTEAEARACKKCRNYLPTPPTEVYYTSRRR